MPAPRSYARGVAHLGQLCRPLPSSRLASRRCISASYGADRPEAAAAVRSIFFLSNRVFDRSRCLDTIIHNAKPRASSTASNTSSNPTHASAGFEATSNTLPHRRRKARRLVEQQQTHQPDGSILPPNASSELTTFAASQPTNSLRRKLSVYLSLTKPRLTVLVVLTAMAPYALYPVPEAITAAATETASLSPLTLLFLTTGTALCSASANTLNMLYEPSTDRKMTRTRNRPLVRGLVTPRAAAAFALLAGAMGVGGLYFGVNPTVSFLGLANIVLYAGVYTPLKAATAFNTWVGAVVGGIPPLMGWAAAAGEAATKDGTWRELLFASDGSSIGGWLLSGLLFAWQFPHFMGLSWQIREEYKQAGLRMLAWTNPARNARVALRYSLVFIPICVSLCAAEVTDWSFALTSLPINLWLVRSAVHFWRHQGHKGSARSLFWASVWHLPAVMILALLHKKGMWARAWRGVFGNEGDGEWEDDELDEMISMAASPPPTTGPRQGASLSQR